MSTTLEPEAPHAAWALAPAPAYRMRGAIAKRVVARILRRVPVTARLSTGEVYGAAAAERTIALRRRTAAALEQLGVDVLDAPPDELPVRLADHYLMLKRQGRL